MSNAWTWTPMNDLVRGVVSTEATQRGLRLTVVSTPAFTSWFVFAGETMLHVQNETASLEDCQRAAEAWAGRFMEGRAA